MSSHSTPHAHFSPQAEPCPLRKQAKDLLKSYRAGIIQPSPKSSASIGSRPGARWRMWDM